MIYIYIHTYIYIYIYIGVCVFQIFRSAKVWLFLGLPARARLGGLDDSGQPGLDLHRGTKAGAAGDPLVNIQNQL